MKPILCKAGQQLREMIDDAYPDRDRKSDGWIGDAAHSNRKSDHNPDPSNGIVRAIDVDKDFDSRPSTGAYLADQIRLCAKSGEKRISMSSMQERLPVLKELGVGVLTMGLISTITIFIFHSLKKATRMVAGLIYRC
jgi:hypothetical protein